MSTIFRNSTGKPSKLSLGDLLGGLSVAIFLLAEQYVSGGISAYFSLLAFVLYGWLFYLIRVFYCWIARKDFPKAADFSLAYVRKIGSILFLLALALGSFTVYQNEIDPAKLPEYTISNGEKTVRFRAMAHIASEKFYT